MTVEVTDGKLFDWRGRRAGVLGGVHGGKADLVSF